MVSASFALRGPLHAAVVLPAAYGMNEQNGSARAAPLRRETRVLFPRPALPTNQNQSLHFAAFPLPASPYCTLKASGSVLPFECTTARATLVPLPLSS